MNLPVRRPKNKPLSLTLISLAYMICLNEVDWTHPTMGDYSAWNQMKNGSMMCCFKFSLGFGVSLVCLSQVSLYKNKRAWLCAAVSRHKSGYFHSRWFCLPRPTSTYPMNEQRNGKELEMKRIRVSQVSPCQATLISLPKCGERNRHSGN